MPVYVYSCDHCGFQFEHQQKFSDNPLKKCPECGQNLLHKVYTPVGIIYKGSGFYSTDHRSSSRTIPPGKPKDKAKKPEEQGKKEKAGVKNDKGSKATKSD